MSKQTTGMVAVELPEPSEYPAEGQAQWNIYPFVRVEGDEIKLGAKCEYLYTINAAEARGGRSRTAGCRRHGCIRIVIRTEVGVTFQDEIGGCRDLPPAFDDCKHRPCPTCGASVDEQCSFTVTTVDENKRLITVRRPRHLPCLARARSA